VDAAWTLQPGSLILVDENIGLTVRVHYLNLEGYIFYHRSVLSSSMPLLRSKRHQDYNCEAIAKARNYEPKGKNTNHVVRKSVKGLLKDLVKLRGGGGRSSLEPRGLVSNL